MLEQFITGGAEEEDSDAETLSSSFMSDSDDVTDTTTSTNHRISSDQHHKGNKSVEDDNNSDVNSSGYAVRVRHAQTRQVKNDGDIIHHLTLKLDEAECIDLLTDSENDSDAKQTNSEDRKDTSSMQAEKDTEFHSQNIDLACQEILDQTNAEIESGENNSKELSPSVRAQLDSLSSDSDSGLDELDIQVEQLYLQTGVSSVKVGEIANKCQQVTDEMAVKCLKEVGGTTVKCPHDVGGTTVKCPHDVGGMTVKCSHDVGGTTVKCPHDVGGTTIKCPQDVAGMTVKCQQEVAGMTVKFRQVNLQTGFLSSQHTVPVKYGPDISSTDSELQQLDGPITFQKGTHTKVLSGPILRQILTHSKPTNNKYQPQTDTLPSEALSMRKESTQKSITGENVPTENKFQAFNVLKLKRLGKQDEVVGYSASAHVSTNIAQSGRQTKEQLKSNVCTTNIAHGGRQTKEQLKSNVCTTNIAQGGRQTKEQLKSNVCTTNIAQGGRQTKEQLKSNVRTTNIAQGGRQTKEQLISNVCTPKQKTAMAATSRFSSPRFVSPSSKFESPSNKFVSPSSKFVSPSSKFVSPSSKFVSPSSNFVSRTSTKQLLQLFTSDVQSPFLSSPVFSPSPAKAGMKVGSSYRSKNILTTPTARHIKHLLNILNSSEKKTDDRKLDKNHNLKRKTYEDMAETPKSRKKIILASVDARPVSKNRQHLQTDNPPVSSPDTPTCRIQCSVGRHEYEESDLADCEESDDADEDVRRRKVSVCRRKHRSPTELVKVVNGDKTSCNLAVKQSSQPTTVSSILTQDLPTSVHTTLSTSPAPGTSPAHRPSNTSGPSPAYRLSNNSRTKSAHRPSNTPGTSPAHTPSNTSGTSPAYKLSNNSRTKSGHRPSNTPGISPAHRPSNTSGTGPAYKISNNSRTKSAHRPSNTPGTSPAHRPSNTSGTSPAYRLSNNSRTKSAHRPSNTPGTSLAHRPSNTSGTSPAHRPSNTSGTSPAHRPSNTSGTKTVPNVYNKSLASKIQTLDRLTARSEQHEIAKSPVFGRTPVSNKQLACKSPIVTSTCQVAGAFSRSRTLGRTSKSKRPGITSESGLKGTPGTAIGSQVQSLLQNRRISSRVEIETQSSKGTLSNPVTRGPKMVTPESSSRTGDRSAPNETVDKMYVSQPDMDESEYPDLIMEYEDIGRKPVESLIKKERIILDQPLMVTEDKDTLKRKSRLVRDLYQAKEENSHCLFSNGIFRLPTRGHLSQKALKANPPCSVQSGQAGAGSKGYNSKDRSRVHLPAKAQSDANRTAVTSTPSKVHHSQMSLDISCIPTAPPLTQNVPTVIESAQVGKDTCPLDECTGDSDVGSYDLGVAEAQHDQTLDSCEDSYSVGSDSLKGKIRFGSAAKLTKSLSNRQKAKPQKTIQKKTIRSVPCFGGHQVSISAKMARVTQWLKSSGKMKMQSEKESRQRQVDDEQLKVFSVSSSSEHEAAGSRFLFNNDDSSSHESGDSLTESSRLQEVSDYDNDRQNKVQESSSDKTYSQHQPNEKHMRSCSSSDENNDTFVSLSPYGKVHKAHNKYSLKNRSRRIEKSTSLFSRRQNPLRTSHSYRIRENQTTPGSYSSSKRERQYNRIDEIVSPKRQVKILDHNSISLNSSVCMGPGKCTKTICFDCAMD